MKKIKKLLMKEESEQNKIYKNANPTNILNFVGSNQSTVIANSPIIKSRKFKRRFSLFSNSKKNIKYTTSTKLIHLNPVLEKYEKNEDSSFESNNKISSKNIMRKSFKNSKSSYVNNPYFNNKYNLMNRPIYKSTNKVYNYNRNDYLMNSSTIIDDNAEQFSLHDENLYSNKELSRSFKLNVNNEFTLNQIHEIDEEKEMKKNKYKIFQKNAKEIKTKFYFLISIFYYSIYLLCMKIIAKLPLPEIPCLGVSSFIICFNNLVLSALFIKLNDLDLYNYLDFDKFSNYFIKIILNYIKILLILKILQHLNLLSYIIIINLNSLIISYIFIKENNKLYYYTDFCYYIIFFLIYISEFFANNKMSMVCIFILMILNTFSYFTNINILKYFHSYLIAFGSSLIGIAISPLIMIINNDSLNISFSQYLLYMIISFVYFLKNYFCYKYNQYSIGHGYPILYNIIIAFLYLIYSLFILKEEIYFKSLLFLLLSAISNVYGKIRIESVNY